MRWVRFARYLVVALAGAAGVATALKADFYFGRPSSESGYIYLGLVFLALVVIGFGVGWWNWRSVIGFCVAAAVAGFAIRGNWRIDSCSCDWNPESPGYDWYLMSILKGFVYACGFSFPAWGIGRFARWLRGRTGSR